jgi:hypothetical protein
MGKLEGIAIPPSQVVTCFLSGCGSLIRIIELDLYIIPRDSHDWSFEA